MADKMWAVYDDSGSLVCRTLNIDKAEADWYAELTHCTARQVVVLPVEEYDGMVATNNMNVRELKAMRQARQTFQTHSFD
jgi:hypothetical protein